MTTDELQSQKNIEIFRERRNRQWIVTIPFVLLVFAATWLRDHPTQTFVAANTFFTIFIGALVGITVFTFRNWRCPACNGYLGRAMSPKFCPKCGAQLA